MTIAPFPQILIRDLIAAGEAALKTGPFGTQLKASEYTERGTPVINVRNIGMGGIKPDKLEYISDATRDRLSSHVLRRDDIVFGRKGAVERHVFIRQEQDGWFQGSDCLRLRFDSGRVFPLFASYFFLTREHQQWMVNQCSHGATMASLNQEILERIAFPLPPILTQRRIAGVLSAYDDLIEINQRRIRIVEDMARALYREWIVNFRSPGGEQLPLVGSALGNIPLGWEVKRLGDVADVRWGDTLTTKASYANEGYTAYSASGPDGRLDHYDFDRTGIVLSAIGAQCGKTWLARGKWSCIKNTIRFWSKCECVSTEFLFIATYGQDFWPRRGAAQPFISQGDLEQKQLLIPDGMTMQRFTRFAADALCEVAALNAQIHNLRRTRNLLLPRLLSGQVSLDTD